MQSDFHIPKRMADIVVKVCFDITEFSRLYDNDGPNSIQRYFQCNDEIIIGLKWFIGSENFQSMYENVGAYLKCIETTLEVYNNLHLPFKNKKEIITALNSLHFHLAELQQHVHKTYCQDSI